MASPPNPDFQGLIARVARALEEREIPFMLIGGQAVLLHGEPRRCGSGLEGAEVP